MQVRSPAVDCLLDILSKAVLKKSVLGKETKLPVLPELPCQE